MFRLGLAACSSLLRCHGLPHISSQIVRGVLPENQSDYRCLSEPCTFACFSSPATVFPLSAVNDNFCDCEDGSDEPGTAACAGQSLTFFHCPNEHGVPRTIYASHVDDGICDCCDGSDELHSLATGRSQCPDTCAEEAAERLQFLERLRKGLAQQKEVRRNAKNRRQQWRTEIATLKSELQDLEQTLATQIPPAVAVRFNQVMDLIKTMQAEIREHNVQMSQMRSRQDELVAENKWLHDAIANCSEAKQLTRKLTQDNATESRPKQQVSEYAKWMDNSDTVLESTNKPAQDAEQSQSSSNSLKAEALGNENSVEPFLSNVNQTELQQAIDSKKARVAELQDKLDFLSDDKLAYFSLMDKCLEHKAGDYTYKICFFTTAHQGDLLLGSWSKWQSQRQGLFKGGQSCGGDINRELLVKFKCGDEERILEVSEPNRCMYEAVVHAPGACGKKSLQELEKATPDMRFFKAEL